MDGPQEELAVNVDLPNSSETNNNQEGSTTRRVSDALPIHSSGSSPSRNSRQHRHRRHRHPHHRRRRHGVRSGDLRFEKTLLHFSAAHILLGIVCVLLQMVQFTNHSILSEAQPGLWCGTFFVITGSVCLGLAKTKGLYSTVTMLCFCLVSLFMALTLASLSWLGSQAALCCEDFWEYNCEDDDGLPTFNITKTTSTMTTASEFQTTTPFVQLTSSTENTTNSCYGPIENGPSCENIKHGYCGYDIQLGRTLHLLLLVSGVIGATTSFVLSTLACSRPNRESAGIRPRLSSIFVVGGDNLPTGGRPITAWEFPPPTKDTELANTPGIEEQYPDEPPPPYVEQDNADLQCHL
ncbi:uncharacterized protein LOC124321055 [Daphnia pulicaria]|uniref:uncharacterized protein LOC124321055 n=1 Tax=Daphnia pulicaria TaxID=35523 RepID=UPI001EEAABD2|nr:uncharacterized protein LOC124321055 [Daphnia pulicaria]XP_046639921.1 uncharacterized protein LOC124321055 [Daphnia pulicaria]